MKFFNFVFSLFRQKEISVENNNFSFWCSGCIEEWTNEQEKNGYKCYCERNGRTLKSVLFESNKK